MSSKYCQARSVPVKAIGASHYYPVIITETTEQSNIQSTTKGLNHYHIASITEYGVGQEKELGEERERSLPTPMAVTP